MYEFYLHIFVLYTKTKVKKISNQSFIFSTLYTIFRHATVHRNVIHYAHTFTQNKSKVSKENNKPNDRAENEETAATVVKISLILLLNASHDNHWPLTRSVKVLYPRH